ncbi:MAG TPA: rhomboid family intramembrane serine protease [Candidatus Acidoferrum sp.]|jgi:membrane associated rhomboid family serine protease|nr:rhomboid family intramembrane serine protease [Candidatus Acidoferrum sp.]
MLIPIGHENMTARRWPVITLALIAINVAVFLFTSSAIEEESPQLRDARVQILILAAEHPELTLQPEAQHLVDTFKQSDPAAWAQLQNPYRDVINAYDAKVKLMDDPAVLQKEMDTSTAEYEKINSASLPERYAFVPARPTAISYLTANFLHGGWLHLIGNIWFLWLAGFVLEDVWGRRVYTGFYLIAGAAALQFHAWSNPGSMIPTLGASGAVAALMGAFLVRFPKMKIEMAWFFLMRPFLFRFKAAAYWLLPLWLLMEVFYGTLSGSSGVAHWAHVGGFLFGALAATGLHYSGLEHEANKAIEEKVSWTPDAEIGQASGLMDHGQLDEAAAMLNEHLALKPDSLDGWNLVKQVHWRRQETMAFQQATLKTCALHLKARNPEAAWKDYEEFLNCGGESVPADTWLELCKAADDLQIYERALCEYQRLAETHPNERQGLMAQLGAAKVCLKRLNRPQDALAFYQSAAASKIPHLDWEQNIQAGIKEAKEAIDGRASLSASAH